MFIVGAFFSFHDSQMNIKFGLALLINWMHPWWIIFYFLKYNLVKTILVMHWFCCNITCMSMVQTGSVSLSLLVHACVGLVLLVIVFCSYVLWSHNHCIALVEFSLTGSRGSSGSVWWWSCWTVWLLGCTSPARTSTAPPSAARSCRSVWGTGYFQQKPVNESFASLISSCWTREVSAR